MAGGASDRPSARRERVEHPHPNRPEVPDVARHHNQPVHACMANSPHIASVGKIQPQLGRRLLLVIHGFMPRLLQRGTI